MKRAGPERGPRPSSYLGHTAELAWPSEGVALLALNRPAVLNAINVQMIDEVGHALAVARQEGARALVITGNGRSFCVGADLGMLAEGSSFAEGGMKFRDHFLAPLASLLDNFEEMPFPIIAAVNGHALGGGCEMALSSDIRLMADDAVLGLPEVRLGATPGAGGVQKLIRHVGRAKALEWILLGRNITAEEAEQRGLISQVVSKRNLIPAALDIAREICALGPTAIAQAKRSIYLAEDADLRTARRFGVEALTALSSTREWREGVTAFLERREPKFAPSKSKTGEPGE